MGAKGSGQDAPVGNISGPILLAPADDMLTAYSVIGLPVTWLVRPSGEIERLWIGPVDVSDIKAYLET